MALTKALGGGSSSALTVKDEGVTLSSAVTSIDFVGSGVTATNVGGAVTATIGSGSGAEVLITESIAGVGGVSSFSFTSISSSYRDLRVVVRGRGTKSASLTTITMRVNNDSSAIYDYERLELNNASFANAGFVAQTSWQLGYLPAASAVSGISSTAEARLYDYRGTTYHKSMRVANGVKFSTGTPAAGDLAIDRIEGWYRSTSAITRVDLFCDSGNFDQDTVCSLYGIL